MNVESIYDLYRKVQEHPDYVFGTIFTVGDFSSKESAKNFHAKSAVDRLIETGNIMISGYEWDEKEV